MVEVQMHGFSFEKWIRDTLFQGYSGKYSQKWDVPPECNQHKAIPEPCRNLPVSIKTAKYGSPIGLGDVPRQHSIQEPFLMIVGFWKQRSPSEKWFEEIGYVKFSPEVWNSLWGNFSIAQIRELDGVVKNLSENYSIVRQKAKQWKRDTASQSGSIIIITPKLIPKLRDVFNVLCPSLFFGTKLDVFQHLWIHQNYLAFDLRIQFYHQPAPLIQGKLRARYNRLYPFLSHLNIFRI